MKFSSNNTTKAVLYPQVKVPLQELIFYIAFIKQAKLIC